MLSNVEKGNSLMLTRLIAVASSNIDQNDGCSKM